MQVAKGQLQDRQRRLPAHQQPAVITGMSSSNLENENATLRARVAFLEEQERLRAAEAK